jgi:FkbM family methyltransferase
MRRKIHLWWIRGINQIIRITELFLFYPKLQAQLVSSLDSHKEIKIFDVGANRGQSILFFNKIFKASTIYAFEASPNVFKKLQQNTINMKHVHVYNLAISDDVEILEFHESILDETSSFTKPYLDSKWHILKSRVLMVSPNKMYKTIQLHTQTLDKFCEEQKITEINLLKIDVEGHELQVLKGSMGLLAKGKIFMILIERHADGMRKDDSKEIEKLLTNNYFTRVQELKHPIGNYYDDLWVRQKVSKA